MASSTPNIKLLIISSEAQGEWRDQEQGYWGAGRRRRSSNACGSSCSFDEVNLKWICSVPYVLLVLCLLCSWNCTWYQVYWRMHGARSIQPLRTDVAGFFFFFFFWVTVRFMFVLSRRNMLNMYRVKYILTMNKKKKRKNYDSMARKKPAVASGIAQPENTDRMWFASWILGTREITSEICLLRKAL